MNKLSTLRQIGYAAAESFEELPYKFFKELAENLYPVSNHRREWALSNMELFYSNRRTEIDITKG